MGPMPITSLSGDLYFLLLWMILAGHLGFLNENKSETRSLIYQFTLYIVSIHLIHKNPTPKELDMIKVKNSICPSFMLIE